MAYKVKSLWDANIDFMCIQYRNTQISVRCSGSCLQSQLLGRVRLGVSWIEFSPGEKLWRPHLNKTSLAWWYSPVIPAIQEAIGRWIAVQVWPQAKT
jgi:hypothetical protein